MEYSSAIQPLDGIAARDIPNTLQDIQALQEPCRDGTCCNAPSQNMITKASNHPGSLLHAERCIGTKP